MSGILGRKIGMTAFYDAAGKSVSCTVIQAGPCIVTQVKTKEHDGYVAVQLGFEALAPERAEKLMTKPERGHLSKAGVSTMVRTLREFRDFALDELAVGKVVNVSDVLAPGDTVRVVSTSKGRGFQGVVKRHHFGGVGMATHGQSDRQRAPGSIGSSSYPSRVFPGTRMGGRMGHARTTVRNLKVLRIVPDQNLLVISGSIPGAPNELVQVIKQK